MGLIKKFNLICSAIFLAGLLGIGVIFYNLEMSKARHEAVKAADVILETAFAASKYTSQEIAPLFTLKVCESDDIFYPQAIPAYAANRIFRLLEKKSQDYSYREVASNPRNLEDLPTEWEVGVIRHYREHPDAKRMIYNRKKDDKDFLYIAYPIKIIDRKCLECHTDAKTAPKTLVSRYGSVNGMHWEFGKIIGARFVGIPMSPLKQKGMSNLFTMFISLISIFTIIFIGINFMLSKWFMEPLEKITEITENISLGKRRHENFPDVSTQEMKGLAEAVKRLEISLGKAMSTMPDNH